MHSLKSIYRSALKSNRRISWWLTALMGAIALSLAAPALSAAAETARRRPQRPRAQTRTTTNAPVTALGGQSRRRRRRRNAGAVQVQMQRADHRLPGADTGADHGDRRPAAGHQLRRTPLTEAFSCSRGVPRLRGELRGRHHQRSVRADHRPVRNRLEAVHRTARGRTADGHLRVPGKGRDHTGDRRALRSRPPGGLPGHQGVG